MVIVGCCGFNPKLNEVDAMVAEEKLEPLRAFRKGGIFVSDNTLFFARLVPALREGVAILTRCAYKGKDFIKSLETIEFIPKRGF